MTYLVHHLILIGVLYFVGWFVYRSDLIQPIQENREQHQPSQESLFPGIAINGGQSQLEISRDPGDSSHLDESACCANRAENEPKIQDLTFPDAHSSGEINQSHFHGATGTMAVSKSQRKIGMGLSEGGEERFFL